MLGEPRRRRRNPPSLLRPVDEIVMDERHRVKELERRRGPHDRLARLPLVVATGGAEPPVAERGSDPLLAGLDETPDLVHQGQAARVESLDALAARVEERRQGGVDTLSEILRHGRQYRKGRRLRGRDYHPWSRCWSPGPGSVP